jgi:uracil-DNA glycosylase
LNHRLTSSARPYSEPSATIVWEELYRLGIEERTILWNALPMHPHKPGNKQSNRTPKSYEIKIGKPGLQILVDEFPKAKVVAVGRKAERSLKSMGIVPAATVRHPARGERPHLREGWNYLFVASPRELRLSKVCSIIARSGIARPNLQGCYVYSSQSKDERLGKLGDLWESP